MIRRYVFPPLALAAVSLFASGCGGERVSIPDPAPAAGSDEGVPIDAPEAAVESALIVQRRACEVIIAGGSTAALAAALAAAGEGRDTCLLEPTEWTGGQLTASGVPAVDEAWHKVTSAREPNPGGPPQPPDVLDVSKISRDPANMTPSFLAMLTPTGNPGGCWVSRYCFEPKPFLLAQIFPAESRVRSKLTVFRNTVVRKVTTAGGAVTKVVAVRRKPRPGVTWGGYDALLSSDLADWYAPRDSARYEKELLTFEGPNGKAPVVVDATEWGEVLALADAAYVQGVDVVDGARESDDRCGQATVFGFAEKLESAPVTEPELPAATSVSKSFYSLAPGADVTESAQWDRIFRYRRLRGRGASSNVGEVSLQNWNPGNDYPFGYLLLSKADAREQARRDEWSGGVDVAVLAAAERHAYGFHVFFKEKGASYGQHVRLDRTIFGTGHGLSKVPYVRDTRRSIGVGGFILKVGDLTGTAKQKTGKRFRDRIAIGAYPADVHPLTVCRYPAHVKEYDVLPFFIPFRALTNETYGNLLVAGKTMAQSFMANAATRLHPIEWATGTAAGVAAAAMSEADLTSAGLLERIEPLKARVRRRTPTEWTIDGAKLPAEDEPTSL